MPTIMDPIRVQTQLKSRYPVFDASGKLPFDIVFGLRRKSESDPRDTSFQTTHSFLDVPYALAKGLLRIHELRRSSDDTKGPEEHVEVDLSALQDAIAGAEDESVVLEHIILPSKSNKTEKRGQIGVTEYHYQIEAGSPLASCFEVGKKYSIGLANRDLGTHRWINSSNPPSSGTDTASNPTAAESTDHITETCNLRSSPHGGFAVFTVAEGLTWPPPIETRIHLLPPDPSTTNSETPSSGQTSLDQPILRITVTNPTPTPISIQTTGHQRFLSPWGPFQPESSDGLNPGRRPTILAPSSSAGIANLQIINLRTGAVVRDSPKPAVCGAGRPDLRPKAEDIVVLESGVAVMRDIELGGLVRGLEDGRYVVRLNPKGCWWCFGEVGEGELGDGGRVPKRVYGAKRHQTPAVLRSDDEVEFILKNSRIVQD